MTNPNRMHNFYTVTKVIYNKAVRDKIPQIIENSNSKCNFKTLNDEEFLVEIQKKLSEEVQEYQNNNDVTELADILEVVHRIAQLKGVSKEELEKIRIQKAKERGSFDKNLFLINTD